MNSPQNNTAQDQNLLMESRAGLIVASQMENSGLTHLDHPSIRRRVLGLAHTSDGRPQIRIDSEGLSLDQKIMIERQLLRHLDAQSWANVSIYFQRASSAKADSDASISVATKVNAPFGLQIDRRAIPGVRSVIVVASGKGGVGKSTVAVNLAAGLTASDLRVGLMDCDVYGPSAPMMLGAKGPMDVKQGRLIPVMAHGLKIVSFGFLTDVQSPVIWRGPMVGQAIRQFCDDVNWGEIDVLVIDLPPGTGDVQLTLAEKLPITGAVIVTTPQDVALIDAHKAVTMFEKLQVPILGVVENMAFHSCEACGHRDFIFGDEAFEEFLSERKLPLLARIPLLKAIRLQCDVGIPAVLTSEKIAKTYQDLATYVQSTLTVKHSLKKGSTLDDSTT